MDYRRKRELRERRRKLIATVVAVIAVVALVLLSVAPAFAAGGQEFTHYWVEARAHEDGRVDVEIDLEYDFGAEESHGVYLTYLTRQRIEGDPDHYRVLEYSNFRAASPTAPADFRIETVDDGIGVYVGDPDVYVSGTHEYTIGFTVDGVINSGAGEHGEDEIFWNPIGSGFDDLIHDVKLTLTAPASTRDTACWSGDFGSSTPCTGTAVGAEKVTFTQASLLPGDGLTIAAGYDGGTFSGVEPILQQRRTFTNTMGGGVVAGIAGAGSLLLAILAPLGVGFLRRDKRFVGLTPGLMPPPGAPESIGPAPRKGGHAVQFTPPAGLIPADIGMIIAAKSRPAQHAATLVDLAVRGYLRISTSKKKNGRSKWDLTRVHEETENLTRYERKLLRILFKKNLTVNLEKLPSSSGAKIAALTRKQHKRMASEGWFTSDPSSAKGVVIGIGGALLGIGAAAMAFAAFAGVGLLALPIAVAGIALMFSGWAAVQRTAKGHAYYVQSMGFKKYLETAEAGQLRFEAGEDIFSAYLPYAMVFGVVKRWSALFEELHARGEWDVNPAWFTGTVVGVALFANPGEMAAFTSNLAGLESAASLSTMTGATTGSSRGSSFSGGGFSGGGVGGGGGGSW